MNKAATLLIYLLAATAAPCADIQFGETIDVMTSDKRVVNTITVDLMPVHEWLRDRAGERPMAHWKQFHVFCLKRKLAGLEKCVVKTEEGNLVEMVIKNMPVEVKEYLHSINERDLAIARLRSEISFLQSVVRREDAVTPTAIFGLPEQINPLLEDRARVNLDSVLLTEKKELLAELEAQQKDMRAHGPEQTRILAMFSGIRYGGFDVWDCGYRKSYPCNPQHLQSTNRPCGTPTKTKHRGVGSQWASN